MKGCRRSSAAFVTTSRRFQKAYFTLDVRILNPPMASPYQDYPQWLQVTGTKESYRDTRAAYPVFITAASEELADAISSWYPNPTDYDHLPSSSSSEAELIANKIVFVYSGPTYYTADPETAFIPTWTIQQSIHLKEILMNVLATDTSRVREWATAREPGMMGRPMRRRTERRDSLESEFMSTSLATFWALTIRTVAQPSETHTRCRHLPSALLSPEGGRKTPGRVPICPDGAPCKAEPTVRL